MRKIDLSLGVCFSAYSFASNHVLLTQLNDARQSKIDTALSLNNSIGTTEVIEQNEQIINAIYFGKIIYGDYNLDSTQIANVDYIAPQCPIEGGRAVFVAQVIKRLLGDSTIYDDSLSCAGSESRLAHKPNSDNSYFIDVYPNPANENCTFNYKLPIDKSGKIQIFNILGSKIADLKLRERSFLTSFSTSGFKAGFYLFRLISDGSIIGSGKLAIVR